MHRVVGYIFGRWANRFSLVVIYDSNDFCEVPFNQTICAFSQISEPIQDMLNVKPIILRNGGGQNVAPPVSRLSLLPNMFDIHKFSISSRKRKTKPVAVVRRPYA